MRLACTWRPCFCFLCILNIQPRLIESALQCLTADRKRTYLQAICVFKNSYEQYNYLTTRPYFIVLHWVRAVEELLLCRVLTWFLPKIKAHAHDRVGGEIHGDLLWEGVVCIEDEGLHQGGLHRGEGSASGEGGGGPYPGGGGSTSMGVCIWGQGLGRPPGLPIGWVCMGGGGCWPDPHRDTGILRYMVNKWAICILLECFLVTTCKVMFLHLCVILFTGGSLSQHAPQVMTGEGLYPGESLSEGVSVWGSLSRGSLSQGVSLQDTHFSVCRGLSGGLCPGGLCSGVFCPGVSVSRGGLCPERGVCPEGSLSAGVSVWGSLSRGSLPEGVSVRETPRQRPPPPVQ